MTENSHCLARSIGVAITSKAVPQCVLSDHRARGGGMLFAKRHNVIELAK